MRDCATVGTVARAHAPWDRGTVWGGEKRERPRAKSPDGREHRAKERQTAVGHSRETSLRPAAHLNLNTRVHRLCVLRRRIHPSHTFSSVIQLSIPPALPRHPSLPLSIHLHIRHISRGPQHTYTLSLSLALASRPHTRRRHLPPPYTPFTFLPHPIWQSRTRQHTHRGTSSRPAISCRATFSPTHSSTTLAVWADGRTQTAKTAKAP